MTVGAVPLAGNLPVPKPLPHAHKEGKVAVIFEKRLFGISEHHELGPDGAQQLVLQTVVPPQTAGDLHYPFAQRTAVKILVLVQDLLLLA